MSDIDRQVNSTDDSKSHFNRMLPRKGFAAKLLISHLSVAALGLIVLLSALVSIHFLRARIITLTHESNPVEQAATQLLTNVHKSIAELRGWVSLGDQKFITEWQDSWSMGIRPALEILLQHENVLNASGSGDAISNLPYLLDELEESQWWVSRIAQTPGNEPAVVTYMFEVEPVLADLTETMNAIRLELSKSAYLLTDEDMSIIRETHLALINTKMQLSQMIFRGSLDLESSLWNNVKVMHDSVPRLNNYLSQQSDREILTEMLQHELNVLSEQTEKIIKLSKSEKSNVSYYLMRTETTPAARMVVATLESITLGATRKVRQEALATSKMINITLLAMSLLIIAMIFLAFIFSRARSSELTEPIARLSEAALAFSRGDFTQQVQLQQNDELGDLAHYFNTMLKSIKSYQDELHLANQYLEARVQTRTEELYESRNQLSRIIKASKLGTWYRNTITEKLIFNEQWAAMIGYSKDELPPEVSTFENLLHPEDKDRVLKALDRHIEDAGHPYSEEFRLRTKSGDWEYIYSSGEASQRDEEGNALIISGIHMNITERRQALEDLKQYRDHLEEMVKKRTEEINQRIAETEKLNQTMVDLLADLQTTNQQFKLQSTKLSEKTIELEAANIKLQEMDRLKSMFIASMSHELRTPLNSIIGFTGIILQGLTGEINDEQHDQLQRVYGSAKHLLALISDIIDISKIEVGRVDVKITKFNLDDVIKEVESNFKKEIQNKGLRLEINSPAGLELTSDRKRVLECFFNFMSNAVKFTYEGTIGITIREVDNMVELEVKDTGIGIRKVDLPKLFSPFVRLESPQRGTAPGTGLGLYLTKKLVTAILKGQVSVESEYGKGSTFILRIAKEITAPKVVIPDVKT